MQITAKQKEIEILRTRLNEETETYRAAIKKDLKLELVKPLYQALKATMRELKSMIDEYEKLITDDMENYKK
jgi:hypothetical protein